MNDLLDKASTHLTGESISNCNLEELENLSNQHPYFSVAHLLLAKKYNAENHSNSLPQAQKAALFVSNPHWLDFQLMDSYPEISLADNQEDINIADETDSTDEIETLSEEEQPPVFEIKEETENPSDEFSKEEIYAASSLAKETLSIEEDEAVAVESEDEIEISPDEMHPETEEILEEIVQENVDAKSVVTEEDNFKEQEFSNNNVEVPGSENIREETQLQDFVADPLPEKDLLETVVEGNLIQPVSIEENISTSVDKNTGVTQSEVKTAEPAASTEPLIPIEPYYTVDYFASQGIKFVLDKNPQDKLGKQLKSFTEWLKHMKKLGPEDAIKPGNDTDVDPAIKNIADTSNTQKEILTEAMADVLIKQGKNEQAIELYNKLSFLNPDKSAYFANQIQKLKGA